MKSKKIGGCCQSFLCFIIVNKNIKQMFERMIKTTKNGNN